MDEQEQKKLNKLNARYKRQNDAIKEKYDRISATLPQGTIGRIKAVGVSINSIVNKAVLAELDRLEGEMSDTSEKTPPQAPERSTEPRKDDEPRRELANSEIANMTNSELNEWLQKRQVENAQKRSLQGRLTGIDMSDR